MTIMKTCEATEVFRSNVVAILKMKSLTRSKLAELAGICLPELSNVLNGKQGVSLHRADKIAGALGVSLADLLRTK